MGKKITKYLFEMANGQFEMGRVEPIQKSWLETNGNP